MFDLIVEGFASLRFGCTLGLIVPGLGVAMAARRNAWLAAIGFILVAGVVGWARFAGKWPEPPGTLGLVLMGAVVAVTTVVANRLPLAGVGAAVSGVVAGWLWVPCVGPNLSEPLNDAASDPLGNLAPIVAFVVGAGIPLMVLAALPLAWPRLVDWRDHNVARNAGVVIGAIVGLSIATGLYSDLIARFTGA